MLHLNNLVYQFYTPSDKLSGRSPEGRQMGPNPVLTWAEEALLTTFCINSSCSNAAFRYIVMIYWILCKRL